MNKERTIIKQIIPSSAFAIYTDGKDQFFVALQCWALCQSDSGDIAPYVAGLIIDHSAPVLITATEYVGKDGNWNFIGYNEVAMAIATSDTQVSKTEILEMCLGRFGGRLPIAAIYAHYRNRGIRKEGIENWFMEIEGTEVEVCGRAYKVEASDGALPRRLVAVDRRGDDQEGEDAGRKNP